jgi:hypothetical protein
MPTRSRVVGALDPFNLSLFQDELLDLKDPDHPLASVTVNRAVELI